MSNNSINDAAAPCTLFASKQQWMVRGNFDNWSRTLSTLAMILVVDLSPQIIFSFGVNVEEV